MKGIGTEMKGIGTYKTGERVDLFMLIKQATKGITTTGSPFMTLILQDKTGDIEAKLWDAKEEHEKMFQPASIVRVGGDVHDYRGRNQLRIKSSFMRSCRLISLRSPIRTSSASQDTC